MQSYSNVELLSFMQLELCLTWQSHFLYNAVQYNYTRFTTYLTTYTINTYKPSAKHVLLKSVTKDFMSAVTYALF